MCDRAALSAVATSREAKGRRSDVVIASLSLSLETEAKREKRERKILFSNLSENEKKT